MQAGWCSFSIAGARDEEFFFVHIMHLVWQDEWWVSDASRKKNGPKHSLKTSRANILLAIWRVTFATATLLHFAFQGWAPYLNKSIDIFKTLGEVEAHFLRCLPGLWKVYDPITPLGGKKNPLINSGQNALQFFGSENSTGCKVAPWGTITYSSLAKVQSSTQKCLER